MTTVRGWLYDAAGDATNGWVTVGRLSYPQHKAEGTVVEDHGKVRATADAAWTVDVPEGHTYLFSLRPDNGAQLVLRVAIPAGDAGATVWVSDRVSDDDVSTDLSALDLHLSAGVHLPAPGDDGSVPMVEDGVWTPATVLPDRVWVSLAQQPDALSGQGNVQSVSGIWLNLRRISAAPQVGDFFEYLLPLRAGVWSLTVLLMRDASRGIFDVSIDGVVVATYDAYAAAGAAAAETFTDLEVPQTALVPVRFEVTGQNPSASAAHMTVSAFSMRRTGDLA